MDFPRRVIDRNKDQRRGHSIGQLRAEISHWVEESPERAAIYELIAEAEASGNERRHQELLAAASPKNSSKAGNEHWYKKPVGILIIGVAGSTLALIVRSIALNYFPQWFK